MGRLGRLAGFELAAAGLIVGVLGAGAPVLAQDVPLASPAADTAEALARDTRPYRWVGHEALVEDFLRTAPIERITDIPVGITRPRRAHFAPGGPVGSVAWKPLPKGLLHGKMESYASEIAAYRLSRVLGMDVVPPAVEREIGGVKGAAIFWVDGVHAWDPAHVPQAPGARWSHEMSRMLLFDQLIANIDRNRGNLLLDEAGLSDRPFPGVHDAEVLARVARAPADRPQAVGPHRGLDARRPGRGTPPLACCGAD